MGSFSLVKRNVEVCEGCKEESERNGNGGEKEFVRVRAVTQNGRIFIRANTRRKHGGRFKWLGDWLCPPLKRELWDDHYRGHFDAVLQACRY
jgi:hypothetical protein